MGMGAIVTIAEMIGGWTGLSFSFFTFHFYFVMRVYLTENIFSHADCFTALDVHFVIWDKAVFLIEFHNAFVVFYICVYSEKATGKKLAVASAGNC
jgi:hypothetical protein